MLRSKKRIYCLVNVVELCMRSYVREQKEAVPLGNGIEEVSSVVTVGKLRA